MNDVLENIVIGYIQHHFSKFYNKKTKEFDVKSLAAGVAKALRTFVELQYGVQIRESRRKEK